MRDDDYDRWLCMGDLRGTCPDCGEATRDPGEVCPGCAMARRVEVYTALARGTVPSRGTSDRAERVWDRRAEVCTQVALGQG